MVVGELSPVKQSLTKSAIKYFDGQLSDGKRKVRLILFEPTLRAKMDNAQSQGEVIALTNCTVQQNKYSGSHELEIHVVAGTRTTLLQSPKKFRIDSDTIAAPSALGSCRAVDVRSLDHIADLAVDQQVNLTGKILAVHPPEKVVAKSRGQTLTKQDFTITDCTGDCRGVAWETDVGYFKTDKSYRLENVTIRTFNSAKYIVPLSV